MYVISKIQLKQSNIIYTYKVIYILPFSIYIFIFKILHIFYLIKFQLLVHLYKR